MLKLVSLWLLFFPLYSSYVINHNSNSLTRRHVLIPTKSYEIKVSRCKKFVLQADPYGDERLSTITSSDTKSIYGNDNQGISRIALIIVSALYGSNFGCVKILETAMEPSFAAACRFSLAGLVFFPYVIQRFLKSRSVSWGGIEIGLYSAVGYWAQSEALKTTSASTAAFICSLAVLVVPVLDILFKSKDKNDVPIIDTVAPALLATAGVACLELGGDSLPGTGDLLALLQPLFFGLGFWRVEKHMRNMNSLEDTGAFTGAMMSTVALLAWLWSLYDMNNFSISHAMSLSEVFHLNFQHVFDWKVIAAIVWTGVVTTAITSYIENASMKNLSASESTVIYSTEPLWGTAFAAVTLGEQVGTNTAFGAALILSACLWSSFGPGVVTGVISQLTNNMSELMDELTEKISANWLELFENLQDLKMGN